MVSFAAMSIAASREMARVMMVVRGLCTASASSAPTVPTAAGATCRKVRPFGQMPGGKKSIRRHHRLCQTSSSAKIRVDSAATAGARMAGSSRPVRSVAMPLTARTVGLATPSLRPLPPRRPTRRRWSAGATVQESMPWGSAGRDRKHVVYDAAEALLGGNLESTILAVGA